MTTQKKIDFLIVGAQKAGNMYLKHPEIEMARPQKEVHFFKKVSFY